MPKFIALKDVPEAIHGLALPVPMLAGYSTGTVSDDEAAILRGLPDLFVELKDWSQKAPRNTMVSGPTITKAAQGGDAEE